MAVRSLPLQDGSEGSSFISRTAWRSRTFLTQHHHATLSIAAYGLLIGERGALPLSTRPAFSAPLSRSAISQGYRPRGAADPARATHRHLDRDGAQTPYRSAQLPVSQRAADEEAFRARIGASISAGSRVE